MGKVVDILSGKETFDYHPLPNKKYKVILADPNWAFSTWSSKGKGRSAEKHYESNTVDEICHLEIEDEFGHNAEPINTGRCCDSCNSTFVIPHRIKLQFESECG